MTKYYDKLGRAVPTTEELLGRVYPVSGSGLERTKHPHGTDLSRVVPKRPENEKENLATEIKSR